MNLSFFLASNDISSLSQSLLQAYGPVDGNENTQYRVTSKLSVNSLNTFAVSDGELIVCNVTGQSDKLNLILKPNINYTSEIFKGSPKVKYFVYRGISKSSFFDTGGVVKTTKDNHILNSLNTGSGSGSLSPTQKKLNFNDSLTAITNLATTELIDTLYTQEDYYQIQVKAGDKLAICSNDFGFEIMLEENGFNPTMTQAKLLENIINTNPPAPAPSLSAIEKEVVRLNILNYIDPTAFFGLFFRKNALLIDPKNNKSVPKNAPHYYRWHQYLFLDKFITANTIYIDIRNKYSLPPPINKAGKSFSQIKISVDGNSPVTPTNYKYYNGTSIITVWPIHIIDGTFTHSPTTNTYDYFKIKIAIENKNAKELFHIITNHLGDSWEKEYNHEVQYKKLDDKDSSWKKDVELRTYKADNTKGVASYIKIEIAEYSTESKIEDQIVNYQLHNLTAESNTNQLSPTLIDLGNSNNFTREKEGAAQNKYNTHIYGLGAIIYSENRNIGCEVTQGKAIDSIGEVCFAYRTGKNIQASGITLNQDKIAKIGEGANQISKKLYAQSYAYNTIKNAFAEQIKTITGFDRNNDAEYRSYEENVAVHNHHKKNKSILGIHRVSFNDGTIKKAIEVRINDPIILRGLTGNSPAECFTSVAYTNAQKQTINTLIGNQFETSRFVFFQSKDTTELTVTGRKVFKQTFDLLGLKANGNFLELQPSTLSLTFYSIDGANFSTTDYADAFRNEEGIDNVATDKVITNDVVPNFDVGNPFGSLITNIRTTLNSISNGGIRDRILYNEIRDYLYDGDLDNLTFEIAFRLPFYIEDITKIPYTDMVDIRVSNSRMGAEQATYTKKTVNSPYFKLFENWFNKANTLRIAGGIPLLRRTGLAEDIDSKSAEMYKVFNFSSDFLTNPATDIYSSENVFAYRAKMMNDENPASNYDEKPHLPGNPGNDEKIIKVKQAELTILETAGSTGIISSNTRVQLNKLANDHESTFGFCKEIISGNHGSVTLDSGTFILDTNVVVDNETVETTNYIIKESNSKDFYLVIKPYLTNSSGVTFGFGLDFGQRKMSEFQNFTPYKQGSNYPPDWMSILNQNVKKVSSTSITNISKYDILKDEIHSKKGFYYGAREVFIVFKEILDELNYSFDTAVKLFPDFIGTHEKTNEKRCFRNSNYPILMVNPLLSFTNDEPDLDNNNLPILSSTTYYYESGGLQYMNELEKCILSTITYNGAASGGNLAVNYSRHRWARIARVCVQAINTHDLRWLNLILSPPIHYDSLYKQKLDWCLVTETRVDDLQYVLDSAMGIKHFRTKIND